MSQTNVIKIHLFYIDNGRRISMPCSFYVPQPVFAWDIPSGVNQKSYIFEMKTRYPVYYSDGVTYECAYYNSGIVNSSVPEHRLKVMLNIGQGINGETVHYDTWKGTCEIRLRIFEAPNAKGDEYSTHGEKHDRNIIYEFEKDSNGEYADQGRMWDSTYDGYYFCYDKKHDEFLNQKKNIFSFKKSADSDISRNDLLPFPDTAVEIQKLKYNFQISDSPLFGEGTESDSCISINDITIEDQYASIEGIFQSGKNPEKWIKESIDSLKPNTTYYMRAVAFDGCDYSDWSVVNSFRIISDSVPNARIISVEKPMKKDENGIEVEAERNDGEMIIRIRIDDEDDRYVSCSLCFSMRISETEIKKNGMNCLPNDSDIAVDYEYENSVSSDKTKSKLIRSRINENTLHLPTNTDIFLTWRTLLEIRGTIKKSVYLYLEATDGIVSDVETYGPFTVDNTDLEYGGGGIPYKAQSWWCRGYQEWPFVFPVLPVNMLRQLVVNNLPEPKKDDGGDSDKETSGSVGYTEGSEYDSWYSYWNAYENRNNINGINRITQDGGEKIYHYAKYPVAYDENGNEIPGFAQSPEYLNPTVIKEKGFVSFCPVCDRLYPLKTMILKSDGTVYEKLTDAFKSREFDGTPYTLFFLCPNCRRAYPIEMKYAENLAYGSHLEFHDHVYSYWNGYDYSIINSHNDEISRQLILMKQYEYDTLKKKWEEENGKEKPFPLKYQLIEKWYNGEGNDESKKKDRYGFAPEDKLLKLNPRPEFGAYLPFRPPVARSYHHVQYIDGTKLNGSLEKDYMFGFEDKPKDDINNIPAEKGDLDMQNLSVQTPWAIQNLMMRQYFEGKSNLKKQESGYSGVEDGGGFEIEGDNNNNNSSGGSGEGDFGIAGTVQEVQYEAENPVVGKIYSEGRTILFNRMSCGMKIRFPFSIKRNENDLFKIRLNSDTVKTGSILNEDINSDVCDIPWDNKGNINESNSNWLKLRGYLRCIFGDFFEIPNKFSSLFRVDMKSNSLFMPLYGIKKINIRKFELSDIRGNCYEQLGIYPFCTYQSYSEYIGNGKYLKKGKLSPITPGEGNNGKDSNENTEYYFTERPFARREFHCQESPLDNIIETSQKSNGKPSVSAGEPLFTCRLDELDSNGYHFKYSDDDFIKYGKIYVRTFHIEECCPFPMPGFGPGGSPGFRNWIVIPSDEKEGVYKKVKMINGRGLPPEKRKIDVELDDGTLIEEDGWFPPGGTEPFSHSKKEKPKDDKENEKPDENLPYKRKKDFKWRNNLLPKTCVVFDYVDATEAVNKNCSDYFQGIPPLNHKCPFSFNNGIYDVIDRYGMYVMGGYDLTDEQKELNEENNSYSKKFTRKKKVIGEDGKVTEVDVDYYVRMPGNWRPESIKGVFDVDEKDGKPINYLKITRSKKDKNKLIYDTSGSVSSMQRYNKSWKNVVSIPPGSGELSQFTVEQFNPRINNRIGIYEKWGYQPKNLVDSYWKIEKGAKESGKYLSESGNIVHDIYSDENYGGIGDPFADFRIISRIMKERYLISDVSLKKTDENYDRVPWIDYRLVGMNNLKVNKYFSGFPKKDHPSYETRPEPVYPYDNHWRIGGLKKEKIDDENYEIKPGAFIDKLKPYQSLWEFYYLQKEWNNYNRIHWSEVQGESDYACLYAQEISADGSSVGSEFSVKTASSIWSDEYNAWCIPYNKSNTDMIDSTSNQIKKETPYKFFMKFINMNTGMENSNAIESARFSISDFAVSPATVVGTDYDPWTGVLTVEFRFDDAMGREYDVIDVQFVQNDKIQNIDENGNILSETVNEYWIPIGINSVRGDLQNLSSNRYGGDTYSGNSIITHRIFINIKSVGIKATNSLRVKIISSLSADREGMTIPVFEAKMWANEYLVPVENEIMSLQGYKTQWVWVEKIDEKTGTVTGKWEYVDKENAAVVIGKIQDAESKINDINEKFKMNYSSDSRFRYSDLDAFEEWLRSEYGWDSYYYYYFDFFLDETGDEAMKKSFKKFSDEHASSSDKFKKKRWIELNGLKERYEMWYNSHRIYILRRYYIELLNKKETDKFDKWHSFYHSTPEWSDARQEFVKAHRSEFNEFIGEKDPDAPADDADIIRFINETGREEQFIFFYAEFSSYADTRFEERICIMKRDFNQYTYDFNTKSTESEMNDYYYWINNSSLGMSWNEKNDMGEFIFHDSDRYQAFLAFESGTCSDLGESNSGGEGYILPEIKNIGKMLYRNYFLQTSSGNGMTYSNTYQSLNETLSELNRSLVFNLSMKNKIETDHRLGLIMQGFFCNGFQDNIPYKKSKEELPEKKENINTCFRWRVETRPYEGNIESNTADTTITDGDNVETTRGYQPRFDMYFRFQMDFFGTFDSQNGRPLRDIIFGDTDEEGNPKRILAGIENSSGGIQTRPGELTYEENREDIPELNDFEKESTDKSNFGAKEESLQFYGVMGIPLKMMPGQMENDTIPEKLNNSWNDNSSGIPADNYKGVYYWRVAPYNIVERPAYDKMMGISELIGKAEQSALSTDEKIAIYKNGGNVIEESSADYENKKHYTAVFYNKYCSDDIKAGYSDFGYDYYVGKYYRISIAIEELSIPKWKISADLSMEPYNSGKWLNRDILSRGEIQFLTDRPRKIEIPEENTGGEENPNDAVDFSKGTVSYINDSIGNFDTQWIPGMTDRKRPSVIIHDLKYFLFSHKTFRKGYFKGKEYDVNIITMSVGYSPEIFGEAISCFPNYTVESFDSVIKDACSFENPCVIEKDGGWIMFFNALIQKNENTMEREIWSAFSDDLIKWRDFNKISIKGQDNTELKNCTEPFVIVKRNAVTDPETGDISYENSDEYEMYLSVYEETNSYYCIYSFSSNDGCRSFSFLEKIYNDTDGLYSKHSPCVINLKNGKRKLFFSIESAHSENSLPNYIIGSIEDNGTGWRQNEYDDNSSRIIVEKGLGEGLPFAGQFGTEDNYMNPFVMNDSEKTSRSLRMYYNTYDTPYLWYKENLVEIPSIYEMTIHTEFLEEYNWYDISISSNDSYEKIPVLQYGQADETGKIIWDDKLIDKNYHPADYFVKFEWNSSYQKIYSIRIKTWANSKIIECISQAKWIGFDNVKNTEAKINPEKSDDENYDVNDYNELEYISENELLSDYNEWKKENGYSPNENMTENEIAEKYLVERKLYQKYRWWSLKGPGIYRYVGYDIMKGYQWNGKGE